MGKKLKDYYDTEYIKYLAALISEAYPEFNKKKFLNSTKTVIGNLEFNQRQELLAKALYETIDLKYEDILSVFYKILGEELTGNTGAFSKGWRLWPIGKYVEMYGEDYFQQSIQFSKELTKRFTSEYCMRPLIKKYPSQSMNILEEWSKDDNERVRRLSSECLRIRLPWAKKLYAALEHFEQYYIILTNLKNDKDKFIQKSVANNLNDLYKEDKEKFYFIINTWKKEKRSKECEWIIKHASRNVENAGLHN